MRKPRLFFQILFCIQTFAMATSAFAVEYDAEIRAAAGVSDNITRAAQNEIDETITSAGFDFSITKQSNNLDLDIHSQFDYVDYADDTFDSELIGGLNGSATITLVDERLRWVFEDKFGQTLFDPFQPARPDNREDVNTFTTGPTLSLMAASRTPITLDLRYTKVNFEERPNDSDRLSGTLIVGREVRRDSTLSLNFSGTRVEFDDSDLFAPLEQYDVYARYETTGSRSTLGFDLGYNEVEFAGVDGDGLLARVDYTRQTSANGSFSAGGGSQYSEQGDIFDFDRSISQDLTNTSDITNSPAPFQNNFFTLAYTLEQARYSVATAINWNQEDYEAEQGIDRDTFRGDLSFQREVTRTIFAGVNIGFDRRQFDDPDRRDDDLTLGLDIGFHITTGFDISIEFQHFQRNSETPGADFTESRAFVRFSYTPVWSR